MGEEESESESSSSSSSSSSQAKRRRIDEDAEMEAALEDEEEEEEDSESGEEDGEAVLERRTRENQQQEQHRDGVASSSAGVIAEVYAENFMCHRKLRIQPCRRTNFITGANGSGKSAIVAAVQVCLGASARATHRGNKLADLVREGHDGQALVRVTLVNEGSDAVKAEIYGKRISVERKFGRGGQTTLRILDEHGRQISKDRKELRLVLDALKITVDNPVCVLDQENSKHFIRGKGKEKYDFFLRATDIRAVLSKIKQVNTHAQQMQRDASKQRAKLQSYANAYEEAKAEYDEVRRLEEYDSKIAELKHVGVWVEVAGAERAEQTAREAYEAKRSEVEGLEADYEALKKEYDSRFLATDEADATERELTRLRADVEACVESSRAAAKAITDQKGVIRAKNLELENCKKGVEDAKRDVDRAARALDAARRENAAKQSENAGSQAAVRLQALEQEVGVLEQTHVREARALAEAERSEAETGASAKRLALEASDAKIASDAARRELRDAENHLSSLESRRGADPAAAWGATRLGAAVAAARSNFSSAPIGPIGMHSKWRSAEASRRYDLAVDAVIGSRLDCWIVESHRDKEAFLELVGGGGYGDVQVVVQPRRAAYRVDELPGMLTVAALLDVENAAVFNALVDQCQIDASCVFESKEDAETRGMTIRGNEATARPGVLRLLLPNGDETGERRGNLFFKRNARRHRRTTKTSLMGCADGADDDLYREAEIKAHVGDLESRAKSSDARAADCERLAADAARDAREAARKVLRLERQLRATERRLRDAQRAKADAEASNQYNLMDARLVDAAPIETELSELRAALDQASRDEDVARAAVELEREKLGPLETIKQQHDERNQAVEKDARDAEKRVEALVLDQNEAKRDISKLAGRVEKGRSKMAERQRALSEEKDRVQTMVSKAAAFSARLGEEFRDRPTDLAVDGKRYKTHQQVKARIDAIEASKAQALQSRDASGGSNQDLDPIVAKAKMDKAASVFNEKVAGCKKVEEEGDALAADARARWHRLKQIRTFICRRSNRAFDRILNNKGASGALQFNHHDKELSLTYQKDSADTSTQIDNVTSLSGGERSFSTLAMLLALGETIECPFRVMDEFDVFMDQVSRKLAMRELVDMANTHSTRQFIFITPQDLSSLQPSNILKIFKLSPPIRGQQTLVEAGFSAS